MRKAVILLAALPLAACSQQVYSPPAQTFALAPIHALDPGRQALDAELSSHAQVFDPAVTAFDARYRQGVGNDTELSLEGAAHMIEDTGPSTANRTFYSGRAGIRTNPGKSGAAFFAGGGGGYAHSAGGFIAVDSGLSLGYENCYVVPVFSVSGFVSQPLSARAVDVSVDDHYMTDTPKTTVGVLMRGGLRISLSPSRCHAHEEVPWITAGMAMTGLSDSDSSAGMMGLGLGIAIPL